jgi:putative solute:sodium symporter small subunit
MSDEKSDGKPDKRPDGSAGEGDDLKNAYWRANLKLMFLLLVVWFSVSFLCGIVFVEYLNQFRLFGYKLGFWFSQQGSIYFFVVLIFVYAWRMNALDKKFGVEEDE